MARRSLTLVFALVAALPLAGAAHARAPAGFVGITAEELGGVDISDAQRSETLAAQHRAGVRLLRQTFNWAYIERPPTAAQALARSTYELPEGGYPLPGDGSAPGGSAPAAGGSPPPRFDWSIQDALVLAAARAGITVLPVLFNAPSFLTSAPGTTNFSYPPRDPAAMADFASAAVARYGPGGSLWRENGGVRARPIRAWQVWNEPSLRAYWGGKPSAREYVRLLKAVNDAIKRRDKKAEVVTAGIPPSVLKGSVPVKKYVDQVYRAGGKKAFDTLAINSYARSAGELGRLLRSVRKIMNRHGDRRARIWITELGWCDKGPKHRFCVGKRRQASLIRSSLALIRQQRRALRLRGFVYFSWRDGRPYAPDFRNLWGLHTGLLKLDGKPKPSLRVFRSGVRPFD